ncbi:EF-hand and coiled-coil domain-containing protein 1-like [Panthera uncia]|uniref:EF-hand and coiled-coil domain-containing protein 1-like n=1 Tax=Panthera uncia TaxID=29064 RepID=UPI0020FFB96A|nr:EF-hand and coiled-coil domain-containing protein 1-like [Panthera uncia]
MVHTMVVFLAPARWLLCSISHSVLFTNPEGAGWLALGARKSLPAPEFSDNVLQLPCCSSNVREGLRVAGLAPGGALVASPWGRLSGSLPLSLVPTSRVSPAVDGQLFRSVEGQAASDEEEEAQKCQEEQRSLAKVKTLLARLSSCRSGCDEQTAKKLVTYFGHFGSADHACTLGELEARIAVLVEQTLGTPGEEAELQRKVEENEQLRLELQMVETERVRLSLLEEKLVDVVQLLQRLRDLNISKRALGKILLNTLDACKDPTHEGRSGPSAILDALHTALAGCELLRREPSAPASTAPALANPLLISC